MWQTDNLPKLLTFSKEQYHYLYECVSPDDHTDGHYNNNPYYSRNVDFKDQLQYHIDENIIQTELKLARDERITNERNKSYPGRVATALKITL